MSDIGRKDLSSKIGDSVTPDSQKSTLDQAKDQASGAYEKVAGTVQPESQKSTGQKASDTLSGDNKSSTESEGKGYLESAQETLGLKKCE